MGDYARYLRTDDLLSLQRTALERVHRDELLFQVVHQSSELWLRHAGFETETAALWMRSGNLAGAARLLQRAVLGLHLITDQLAMLELIAPVDYHTIRDALGQGSGFESPGFTELQRVATEVEQAFFELLRARDLALLDLYVNPGAHEEVYRIAELLTDWDERLGLWRVHHLKVVERVIGTEAIGTQGTPISVLRELTTQRCFPELWAVRNEIPRALHRDESGGKGRG